MFKDFDQSYLEYLSKVLGVKSLVTNPRPENLSSPAQQEGQEVEAVQLLVFAPQEDLKTHGEFFSKILAAWGVPESDLRVVPLKAGESLPLPSNLNLNPQHVLAFYFAPTSFQEGWVFAGTLPELSQSQDLKRTLWENIKRAKGVGS